MILSCRVLELSFSWESHLHSNTSTFMNLIHRAVDSAFFGSAYYILFLYVWHCLWKSWPLPERVPLGGGGGCLLGAGAGWVTRSWCRRGRKAPWLGAAAPAEAHGAVLQARPEVCASARPCRHAWGKRSSCQWRASVYKMDLRSGIVTFTGFSYFFSCWTICLSDCCYAPCLCFPKIPVQW